MSCRPSHLNVDRFHQPCLLPGRTSRISEDCRPRTTWRPLSLAGSPVLPPLRLTGGFCHADLTVPRQDVNSSFSPCVCHPWTRGVFCTHAGSGPSRVRRRLLSTCLGDPIPLATHWSILRSIVQVCSLTKECQVYQCVPSFSISELFESILLTIVPRILILLL